MSVRSIPLASRRGGEGSFTPRRYPTRETSACGRGVVDGAQPSLSNGSVMPLGAGHAQASGAEVRTPDRLELAQPAIRNDEEDP